MKFTVLALLLIALLSIVACEKDKQEATTSEPAAVEQQAPASEAPVAPPAGEEVNEESEKTEGESH